MAANLRQMPLNSGGGICDTWSLPRAGPALLCVNLQQLSVEVLRQVFVHKTAGVFGVGNHDTRLFVLRVCVFAQVAWSFYTKLRTLERRAALEQVQTTADLLQNVAHQLVKMD